MIYTEKQQEAINACVDFSNRIVSVTGGAGTGKTTIIKEVTRQLIEKGFTVAIAAPTGKASKRIKEATGLEATTIHRLLEYPMPSEEKTNIDITKPKRNKFYRLEYDVVLVDEYAMVNVELHSNLFDSIKDGGVVRCFGDINQLEPIEVEAFWKEKPSRFSYLINSDLFKSIKLDIIHRQQGNSGIVTNAARISKGEMPISNNEDFVISKIGNGTAMSLFDKCIDEKYFTNEKQVIVCQNAGFLGTKRLNQRIQMNRFDPFTSSSNYLIVERGKLSKELEMKLYVGDKVIFTKNDYSIGYFNGESGTIVGFDGQKIKVDVGDRTIIVPPINSVVYFGKCINYNPQIYLDLGYVITTHKSQGSEYQEITYLLDKSSSFMQCKKNFYTAITRAKSKVNLITDDYSIRKSLK